MLLNKEKITQKYGSQQHSVKKQWRQGKEKDTKQIVHHQHHTDEMLKNQ